MLEGGDMSRVNGRNGMGECSYVFIKMEKFKNQKLSALVCQGMNYLHVGNGSQYTKCLLSY